MLARALPSVLALGLMLITLSPAHASEPTDAPPDIIVSHEEPRSMTGGLFFAAIFPGPVIHGSGNYYAGAKTSGAIMTGAEILGAASMVAGLAMGGLSLFNHEADETGGALLAGGLILFWGSWLADIVTTPFQVNRYNNQLKQRGMQFGLAATPPIDSNPATFGLAVRF